MDRLESFYKSLGIKQLANLIGIKGDCFLLRLGRHVSIVAEKCNLDVGFHVTDHFSDVGFNVADLLLSRQ